MTKILEDSLNLLHACVHIYMHILKNNHTHTHTTDTKLKK